MQFDMKLKTRGAEQEEIIAAEFIGVKGIKAKGKRMTIHPVKKISLLETVTDAVPPSPMEPEVPDELPPPEKEKTIPPQVIIEKKPRSKKKGKSGEPDEEDEKPGTIQMELPL